MPEARPSADLDAQSLDGFPSHDLYQRWVDYLLLEGISADGWHKLATECSTLQGVLVRPREAQARFLLAVMVRLLWLFECRGPHTLAQLFLLYESARALLRRRLPWNEEALSVLVLLTAHPSIAAELGPSVLKQVRWRGRPGEAVRRALKRLKRVSSASPEIEQLLSREHHFPQTGDDQTNRHLRQLLAHARRLPDKPSRRWWRKGVALTRQLGKEHLLEEMLPWLESELKNLHHDHPRLLRGMVVLLGHERADQVAHYLEKVVKWGYRRREGYGPQDLALARSGIRSLGRMNTPLALTYLVILGSELRYASATDELLKTLRKLARAEATSLHTLVEVRTAEMSPDSPLGKRLWTSHLHRLERCLRTGRQWARQEWEESYQDSPLLGRMGRKLIWEDDNGAFRWQKGSWRDVDGAPVKPSGQVRLWHPADGPPVPWKIARPLIKQLERQLFDEVPKPGTLVRQYQLAALLRRRDWSFKLVGRYRRRSGAELFLGSCRVLLWVTRATSFGPYSKEGASLQARLQELETSPELGRFPLRVRSEVLRDLHLFCEVCKAKPAKGKPAKHS